MDKEDETEKEQDGKHGAYIVHTHDGKTAPPEQRNVTTERDTMT